MGTTLRKVLVSFAAATFLGTSAAAVTVKSGSKAPDFSLPAHDGKTYKLSDFKGKWVVLEWFNEGCPYVQKHYGKPELNMQSLQKKYGAKDVVWFMVISSAPGEQGYVKPDEAVKLIAEYKMSPKAILLDPLGTVGKKYDAQTTPHMYVINPQGHLVYQGAIDDKPSSRRSSLKGATPLFANALDAAMAGKKIADHTTKAYGCAVKYK